ncbi:hypothetical protein [Eubacterium oxidoreducens]|nr:hypothetical protein [Eubacterium oxidoreducens]
MEDETGLYNLKYLARINNIITTKEIEVMLDKFNLSDAKKSRSKSTRLG